MDRRYVLDASAVVEFLGATDPDRDLMHRIMMGDAAAPEIVDLEVLNAMRKQVRRGQLAPEVAEGAVRDLREFPIARSPHRPLMTRIWDLRHSVTPFDASYVALAEELRVPLVTTDAKLAGSNGHKAEIELYPAS